MGNEFKAMTVKRCAMARGSGGSSISAKLEYFENSRRGVGGKGEGKVTSKGTNARIERMRTRDATDRRTLRGDEWT